MFIRFTCSSKFFYISVIQDCLASECDRDRIFDADQCFNIFIICLTAVIMLISPTHYFSPVILFSSLSSYVVSSYADHVLPIFSCILMLPRAYFFLFLS